MYKSVRIIRIVVALVTMAVPAWALIMGYDSIFRNMQILTALLSGSLVCLAFWILATLIYGRIYCSMICPLGTAMDCSAAAWRLLLRSRRDYRYRPAANPVRWFFFGLAVVLIFAGGPLLPSLLDPYSDYARIIEEYIVQPLGRRGDGVRFCLSTFAVASVTLLAVLGVTRRRGRLLCNTVCPVGTLLSVPARVSYFRVDINTDKCINCGECERVCKAECIDLLHHTVDVSRCVVCFDCTAVCPNSAITYRAGRHRLGMPLMQTTAGTSEAPDSAESIQKTEKPRK